MIGLSHESSSLYVVTSYRKPPWINQTSRVSSNFGVLLKIRPRVRHWSRDADQSGKFVIHCAVAALVVAPPPSMKSIAVEGALDGILVGAVVVATTGLTLAPSMMTCRLLVEVRPLRSVTT
jgi:hypothetical protein